MASSQKYFLFFTILISLIAPQESKGLAFDDLMIDAVGLEWLPPRYSGGYSYNQASYQINNINSDYYGLRHATFKEMNRLARHYGILEVSNNDYGSGQSVEGSIEDSILSIFKYTFSDAVGHNALWGYYNSDTVGGKYVASFSAYYHEYRKDGVHIIETSPTYYSNNWIGWLGGGSSYDLDFSEGRIGHWLVKSKSQGQGPAPVPEPSTILLLGSGIIGLFWHKRKRKSS